jgi:multicomponent Na+:H+ antiporter subunit B
MKIRHVIFALGAIGFAVIWFEGVRKLDPMGNYHGAYGEIMNAVSVPERHSTNVISAVNFDYRGLDTMGEEFILYISVIAVAAILRKQKDEEEEDEDDAPTQLREARDSDAVRLLGVGLVPLTTIFGLYMICHGAVSPGGGFQGGVILATVPLVVYLCAGAKTYLKIAPQLLAKGGEAIGAAGYALIGCLGVLVGKKFLENVVPLGTPGDAWSAGTITLLSLSVGIAVGTGFVELISSFVEELLRKAQK